MTALSVNLNKIALLRNSRGRDYPSVIAFAEKAIAAGADGLTIHPRPDQRHARYGDIAALSELCQAHGVELNIEGYPSDELLDYCLASRVTQFTLVPDAPEQITSDHGWLPSRHFEQLARILHKLRQAGIRSSLFMDTDVDEIRLAKKAGALCIELHTESYARAFASNDHAHHIKCFISAYECALSSGLGVNAGHDLNLHNLPFFLEKIPVDEVSIGHALTIESLAYGWHETIVRYAHICHAARQAT